MAFDLVGGLRVEQAVVLDADLAKQFDLRLEEVDMAFLILQQFLEKVHGDEVVLLPAEP